jgi:WXXGXW repeat (2 copies)
MKKMALLFAALVGLSGILAPTASALSVNISVGDRPYYVHGPGYWASGAYYVWVPGHYAWRNHHRVFVHGHYAVR